ncbi:hypothetical protein B0T13DRAFT_13954 [Neurospora crassa]|nr:hypothetical protein B0T13DRAFT_13954 [Neurospora crassa]
MVGWSIATLHSSWCFGATMTTFQESSWPSKAKLRAVVQGIPSRWLTLRPKSGPFLADHEGFISSALEWKSISTLGSSIDCNLQRAVRKLHQTQPAPAISIQQRGDDDDDEAAIMISVITSDLHLSFGEPPISHRWITTHHAGLDSPCTTQPIRPSSFQSGWQDTSWWVKKKGNVQVRGWIQSVIQAARAVNAIDTNGMRSIWRNCGYYLSNHKAEAV